MSLQISCKGSCKFRLQIVRLLKREKKEDKESITNQMKRMSSEETTKELKHVTTHIFVISASLILAVLVLDVFELFSYHPFCMLIGYGILISEGMLFSRYIKTKDRAFWLKVHLILQTIGLLFVTVGFIAIVVNKFQFNKLQFKSYHSWFGLGAYILTTIQTGVGYVIYYFRKILIKQVGVPLTVKICRLHGISGTFTYILSMVALMFGFRSNYSLSKFGSNFSNYLILLFILVTFVVVFVTPKNSSSNSNANSNNNNIISNISINNSAPDATV